MVLTLILSSTIAGLVLWGILRLCILFSSYRRKELLESSVDSASVIAFFHPYCDSGGGGERVLWIAVEALLRESHIRHFIAIYTRRDDDRSKADILLNVKKRFGIDFSDEEERHIKLVYIDSTSWLEAKWYPVGTMFFQSLGSVLVALECIYRFVPDVYCDTMGAAFSYPVLRWLTGIPVVAYVHYPIISTDMLNRVREQRPSYNNAAGIASSVAVSRVKLLYYRLFAYAYGWAGRHAQLSMVNSTWTLNHIAQLWGFSVNRSSMCDRKIRNSGVLNSTGTSKLCLVYPPCLRRIDDDGEEDDEEDEEEDDDDDDQLTEAAKRLRRKYLHCYDTRANAYTGERLILSVGQFRPEKDHSLQLRAMKCLLELGANDSGKQRYQNVKLVILGSTRHADDEALLNRLRSEAEQLGVEKHVAFVANGSYAELQDYMQRAWVGLHTMWNEHFGISVVEMLAAGLVTVAHNSGGPRMDIITSPPPPSSASAPSPSSLTDKYIDTSNKAASESARVFSVGSTGSRNPGNHTTTGINTDSSSSSSSSTLVPGVMGEQQGSEEDAASTGYLASTDREYAQILAYVLDNYDRHTYMRQRARISAKRFSDRVFRRQFVKHIDELLS